MAEGIKTIPVPVEVFTRLADIVTTLKDTAAELTDVLNSLKETSAKLSDGIYLRTWRPRIDIPTDGEYESTF